MHTNQCVFKKVEIQFIFPNKDLSMWSYIQETIVSPKKQAKIRPKGMGRGGEGIFNQDRELENQKVRFSSFI